MITINFDPNTGVAKLAQTTVIKQGAEAPVHVVFSAAPGEVSSIRLALGKDTTDADKVLAYTDAFDQENDTAWTGTLDATDERLAAFMEGKGPTAVNLELAVTIDSVRQVAPNLSLTVQPPIIVGDPTSEGGPTYYTQAELDALLAALAPAANQADINVSAAASTALFTATEFTMLVRKIIADAGAGAYLGVYALPVASQVLGAIAEVNVELAASANPTIELRNATTGGTLLATIANPAPDVAAHWYGRFRFDGTAWHCLFRAFLS